MNPYSSSLLNDLHHHLPDLLYRSERFQTVQDVLGYVQERAQENPYERERQRYLASLSPPPQRQLVEEEVKEEVKEEVRAPSYHFSSSSSAYVVPPSAIPSSGPSESSSSSSSSRIATTQLLEALMQRRPSRPASNRFRLSVPLDITDITSFFSSEYSAPAPPALQGLSIFQDLLQPVVVRPTEQHLAENTYVYRSDVAHNENCSICQDPMEAGQETRTLLACSHCFHRECIDRWFQEHVQCPVCRRDVRE